MNTAYCQTDIPNARTTTNITYQERQELNALSQKAFGTSSKWKKLLDEGYFELWSRDRQAMVAGTDGKMVTKTFTEKKYVTKYPTVDDIRKYMVGEVEKKNAAEAAAKLEFEAVKLTPKIPADYPFEGAVVTNNKTHEAPATLVNE